MTLEEILLDALARIPGVARATSGFSSADALWIDGREIAHAHRTEAGVAIDLRLGRARLRAMRDELDRDRRFRKRSPERGWAGSDWVELRITRADEIPFVVALVAELARELVPADREPRPPPSPDALAKRRRLHGG